jgi:hypothetical protein
VAHIESGDFFANVAELGCGRTKERGVLAVELGWLAHGD